MFNRKLQFVEGSNGVIYITSDFFDTEQVMIGFSTRYGGVSKPPFNSLNLGFSVPDNPANVVENRIRFVKALGANPYHAVIGNQIHSNQVTVVKEPGSIDMITNPDSGIANTDGLITDSSNIMLLGSFADCVPLYFYEPDRSLIGIVHAGWRGTWQGIAIQAVEKIKQEGGSVSRLKVIIGPSIGPCCYQVGKELYEQWGKGEDREQVFKNKQGYWFLDLWRANKLLLKRAGVPSENILSGELCTMCNHDLLFSHRKGGKYTGRMMGLISLK
ncbi:peptidoglycan editing factor PgeF [Natranaerobius thermophilus]|uniref:Purine nucleoside phosphorylase n=1 Tax=Natranaerobius thermophilus (strain ATCC BAA-1301 / DSM 18059 / JW/NM-WN-LF) TaxID=457570 RepID=B2A2I1_NATTJ|nr:peptidoglycan editing factor PgeF [Natranaerobius thermophilus]ACB84896.1 protein of unknown function DUF152 [Natranaerobius thermophilus JW/NM-WN-LF]